MHPHLSRGALQQLVLLAALFNAQALVCAALCVLGPVKLAVLRLVLAGAYVPWILAIHSSLVGVWIVRIGLRLRECAGVACMRPAASVASVLPLLASCCGRRQCSACHMHLFVWQLEEGLRRNGPLQVHALSNLAWLSKACSASTLSSSIY